MMISQTVISYHFNRKIMELSPKQQAVELIRASHRVLIVAHENPDGDALVSSLSLPLTLNKLKKDKVIITCCASGMRSAAAKNILKSNGFTEVHNGGGWMSLQNKIR